MPLGRAGHDVLPLDQHPDLRQLDDDEVLALATSEGRIVVTCNVEDFPRISGEWAEDGKSHAGCLVLVHIDHGEFGLILRVLSEVFAQRGDPSAWRDTLVFAGRSR